MISCSRGIWLLWWWLEKCSWRQDKVYTDIYEEYKLSRNRGQGQGRESKAEGRACFKPLCWGGVALIPDFDRWPEGTEDQGEQGQDEADWRRWLWISKIGLFVWLGFFEVILLAHTHITFKPRIPLPPPHSQILIISTWPWAFLNKGSSSLIALEVGLSHYPSDFEQR